METIDVKGLTPEAYKIRINTIAGSIKDEIIHRKQVKEGSKAEEAHCIEKLQEVLSYSSPSWHESNGRPIKTFFLEELAFVAAKISLVTGWTGLTPPYHAYLGMDDSGNIAHYGYHFGGDEGRYGHWTIAHQWFPPDSSDVGVVLKQKLDGGDWRYLMAEQSGNMGLRDDRSEETVFLLSGYENAVILRSHKYPGMWVRGEPVSQTSDQADINTVSNADDRTSWKISKI